MCLFCCNTTYGDVQTGTAHGDGRTDLRSGPVTPAERSYGAHLIEG
jgi:hypothetical protein